ncbi:hypothetical protein, partial [Microbacterium sp. C7(2022)]|uniref:hypothetical protein n=1 Tax=Microbacterium sp. C7(2022) TaxID=2992759 RepID=UPI00237C48C6
IDTFIDNFNLEDSYKILIHYVLRNIPEPEIRKNIWNKILSYEKEMLEDLINQEWYDFYLSGLYEEDRLTDTDLEI